MSCFHSPSNLKNLISAPFFKGEWGRGVPTQNYKTTICYNMLYPVFSLNAAATSCKKLEKSYLLICYRTEKTHFGPFFVQKPWCNISSLKNPFESVLSLYAAVTLCKKSEKIHASIFYKT